MRIGIIRIVLLNGDIKESERKRSGEVEKGAVRAAPFLGELNAENVRELSTMPP